MLIISSVLYNCFLFLLSSDAEGLSCICNKGYAQSCEQNPSCSVSGAFAHCIIEVDESNMETVFQGCSDLITTYLTCNGQVTENNAGRLVLCCFTDNCNSIEAVLAQISPTRTGSFPTMTSSSSTLAESPTGEQKQHLTSIYQNVENILY